MTDACQYNETDFNYVSRRWEAAGWYYWYEHDAAGHKLIVGSDSTLAPLLDGGADVRFHGEGGAFEEDAIDHWSPARQLLPSSLALNSFNFKAPRPSGIALPTLNQQGMVPEIESYEYAGAYGFKNAQDGDAQCRIRLEEIEAVARHVDAQGNNRCMMPGRWFRLTDHFNHGPRRRAREPGKDEFLILAVHHIATNNYLPVDGEKVLYRNWLSCSRRNIPWRPGRHFNSIDTRILAPQTAVVVGPSGPDSIHTDEYGRVQVQFHWDREGHNDERSSAWVRVTSSWAGAELGAAAIPRVGSEVVVQWLDGCADHPIITGAVFNQCNMPPWAVPAQKALTGFRSRELAPDKGNSPVGRSNHLILDDTNGQIQAQLKSGHLYSQLSLGCIARIENSRGRSDARGEGWELRTDGHGVARAAKGMLITTEARQAAHGPIKDMGETSHLIDTAARQHQALAQIAQAHNAQESEDNQISIARIMQTEHESIRGSSVNSKDFPEFSKPHLVVASPAGIITATIGDTHIISDRHTTITAGKSLSLATGANIFASIRNAFRLFVQKAGIKMVAAAGDIDVQALSNSIKFLARLDITQSANRIIINAQEEIILNGGGSYAKFGPGSIEIGTSGTFKTHAATHNFLTSKSMSTCATTAAIRHGSLIESEQVLSELIESDSWVEFKLADQNGPIVGERYVLTDPNGKKHLGKVDEQGVAHIAQIPPGSCKIEFPDLGYSTEVSAA
jgi:type VI secretion system secreted protein VgrG